MFLSYRNQSIDLQSNSVDWFLYVGTSLMKELRAKTSFNIVKVGECFSDFFEIASYLEKIEYVRQI